MDLFKTLTSLEETIYEIVLWVLMTPRTLVKTLLAPRWIVDYVTEELAKEPHLRFERYMSPALFWLLVGVLPALPIVHSLLTAYFSPLFGDKGVPLEADLEVGIVLALASPIIYASFAQLLLKMPFERSALRRVYLIHFYATAPMFLVITIASLFWNYSFHATLKVAPDSPDSPAAGALWLCIATSLVIALIVWLFVREIIIYRKLASLTWPQSAWRVGMATVAGLTLVVLVVVGIYFALQALALALPST